MAHQASEHAFAVQIMMLLTQQQARPEIPPLDSLPGQPLPGVEEYIPLMQVCHTANWAGCRVHCWAAPCLAIVSCFVA